ncbi:NAD(+) diphosphatase [Bacteroides sp.]
MNHTAQSWWCVFYKDQLLLEKKRNGTFAIPYGEIPPITIEKQTTVHDITILEGENCKAYSLSFPVEESDQYVMIGLRASYEHLPLSHYQTAGKAHEILYWDRNSRFCSACGTPMEQKEAIMKRCPKCGQEVYPAISTAILVLVRKEDSLLLVHAHNFKGTFNSLVAGFLETGETLEECVVREVKEETGLDVKNITYFGNQPWPYPSGLMVGFITDYAGGEIRLQDEELSAGDFYTRDNLPELPRKLSLARKMIDWWIECSNQ